MPTEFETSHPTAADLIGQASNVFGNAQAASDWMDQPAYGLGWVSPKQMMQTETGASRVKVLLDRLEFSVHC